MTKLLKFALIGSRPSFVKNTIPLRPSFCRFKGGVCSKRQFRPITRQPNSISTGQQSTTWSIVAYNLSDELRIDLAQKSLKHFSEYETNKLPDDIQNEVVMFSRKIVNNCRPERQPKSSEPLNDIFIFRSGSIVFWGVPYDQQRGILHALSPLKIDAHSNDHIQDEKENLEYALSPTIERSKLIQNVLNLKIHPEIDYTRVDQFSFSHAVALSVKLGILESILDDYIESVSWITNEMKGGKGTRLTRNDIFKYAGELYELKHRINLTSDLLDLPDVYWDRHEQETIFLSLISFLDIRRRTSVMNEKLNNCCDLLNLLSSHINDSHHIRLEWMIIALITVEVFIEIIRFVI